MFSALWHNVFFDPVYNALVALIDVVPGGDVGLAIVILTVVVKLVLLPLSIKAARTQRAMRQIEPELKALKEKHKNDREALARATMAAYKEAGIRPFASILLLFIQIPIIIALYLAVYRGGGVPLPDINVDLLYSFVPSPETVNMMFLGLIDMAARSFPLALLAGAMQFVHAHQTLPKPTPKEKGAAPNLKDDIARSMNIQMRYVMPVLIFFVAYTISAAIALYFAISNTVSVIQELAVPTKGKDKPSSDSPQEKTTN